MKTPAEALPDFDWNFDAVPDTELVACCYWEYARESAFIRDVKRRCTDPKSKEMLNLELWKHWGKDIERIQSIGHAADVFLRGFFFDEMADRRPRHPEAPPITGSFPAPWQSLSETERRFRARIRTDVEQLRIVPVKLAHWSWAKEIARECQQNANEQHERRKDWERKYLRRDEKGNFFTLPDAPEPSPGEVIRPRTRWGVGETLMIDIAWDFFTNDEIATYFRKWIKHARPEESPKPDDKGRNKARDWRANLVRLAVMRLLAHFTPLELIDPRRNKFPAIWETKQFAGQKWSDATKWHDARREAGKLFDGLFPFLPPDEKPLSWERPTTGK